MQFDLWVPTANPMTTPELLEAVGTQSEARGIATLWVGEHVVLFERYASTYPYAADGRIPAPSGSGLLEPMVTLSYLAACTERVRLGTAMLLLPQRNPVYTAKSVSSLDWLSGGRVDLGVGVGWLKEEFDALGVPWERRGLRTDEYIEVLRTLWCDDKSAFDGETYSLGECEMFPKPIQKPHPPLHIGGETPAALRRTARIGNGWHSFNRSPAQLATGLTELDTILDEHGRRRDELRITVCPYLNPLTAAEVDQYAEAGADAVAALFFCFSPDDVERTLDGPRGLPGGGGPELIPGAGSAERPDRDVLGLLRRRVSGIGRTARPSRTNGGAASTTRQTSNGARNRTRPKTRAPTTVSTPAGTSRNHCLTRRRRRITTPATPRGSSA